VGCVAWFVSPCESRTTENSILIVEGTVGDKRPNGCFWSRASAQPRVHSLDFSADMQVIDICASFLTILPLLLGPGEERIEDVVDACRRRNAGVRSGCWINGKTVKR
jgi:hypothetical protein